MIGALHNSGARRLIIAVTTTCALIASALVFLAPWAHQGPGRIPLASPMTSGIRIVAFQPLSPTFAWVWLRDETTGNSAIYATANAGRNWQKIALPSQATSDKLGFELVDTKHSFIKLRNGLLASGDSGRSWRDVGLPPGQSLGLGAGFLTPVDGWYIDLTAYPNQIEQPSAMWWTSDGGIEWSQLWQVDARHPEMGGVPLNGSKVVVGFEAPASGWLAVLSGHTAELLHTSDGGHSWSPVTLGLQESPTFFKVAFPTRDSAVLLAQTDAGWFSFRSRNSGASWEIPHALPILPPAPGFTADSPAFIDDNHWVVAHGAQLSVTFDGGKTWRDTDAVLPSGVTVLHDLWFEAGDEGWALGQNGASNEQVLHTVDSGAHWTRVAIPEGI